MFTCGMYFDEYIDGLKMSVNGWTDEQEYDSPLMEGVNHDHVAKPTLDKGSKEVAKRYHNRLLNRQS